MSELTEEIRNTINSMKQGEWYNFIGSCPESRIQLDIAVGLGLLESAPNLKLPYPKYRTPPSESRRIAEQRAKEIMDKVFKGKSSP